MTKKKESNAIQEFIEAAIYTSVALYLGNVIMKQLKEQQRISRIRRFWIEFITGSLMAFIISLTLYAILRDIFKVIP